MKDLDIYLVGGSIRDKLLGLDVYDRDWVVVGATIEKMLHLNFSIVGKDFPVFLHPCTKEEYALARKDIKISYGYTGFSFDISKNIELRDDLYRRDLTINSIALSSKGKIYDPYGGILDFNNKIIKHVSMSFVDDPLRILRVARFAAKFYKFGFHLSIDTILLIRKMLVNENILNLSSERVFQEFLKIIKINDVFIFIDVLRKCNVFIILFSSFFLLYKFTKSYIYIFNYKIWNFNKNLINCAFYYNDSFIVFIFIFLLLFRSMTLSYYFNFKCFYLNSVYIIYFWCFFYRVSNKYKKNLINFFDFFYFYNKFLNIKNIDILFCLKKNDLLKDKLKLISYLLLSELYYKNNNFSNSVYFYKYFIIDIINDMSNIKFNIIFSIKNNIKIKYFVEKSYLKVIKNIKFRYNKLFF